MLLYPENGGHGMLFHDKGGQLFFTLHDPNDKYLECPHFLRAELADGTIPLLP